MRAAIIIFISWLFFSCSNEQPVIVVDKQLDSLFINFVKNAEGHIEALINKHDSASDELAKKYKALLEEAIQDQTDKLKLITITNNFFRLQKEESALLSKLDKAKLDNELLNSKNAIIKDSLHKEKAYSKRISNERNKAQAQVEQASIMKPAKVEVIAYDFRKKKIRTPKTLQFRDTLILVRTNKAKDVKRVVVSFVIPANVLWKGTANIIVTIHGNNVDKGVTVKESFSLNGKEQDVSIPFNGDIEWRVAEHPVEIFNENDLLWNGTLILK